MRRRLGSAANSPGRSAQDADERETRRGNALTATRSTVEPVLSRHSAPSARGLLKRARRTRVGVEPDGGVSGTREREGREALVERFLDLVRSLARRFRRGGELLEDLVQPAVLALIKAIDGYDPGRGTAFSPFALQASSARSSVIIPTWAARCARHASCRSSRCACHQLLVSSALRPLHCPPRRGSPRTRMSASQMCSGRARPTPALARLAVPEPL